MRLLTLPASTRPSTANEYFLHEWENPQGQQRGQWCNNGSFRVILKSSRPDLWWPVMLPLEFVLNYARSLIVVKNQPVKCKTNLESLFKSLPPQSDKQGMLSGVWRRVRASLSDCWGLHYPWCLDRFHGKNCQNLVRILTAFEDRCSRSGLETGDWTGGEC